MIVRLAPVIATSPSVVMLTSPVPFGVTLISPFAFVELSVLPSKRRLSTLKISILLLASTINAKLAVKVH